MIVLIDGYNLLRQVFHKVKGKLDKQRQQLIKELGYYKNKKPKIKNIIIVFDGGLFGHATREIKNGIVVIFSGQRESADTWILNYVEKHKNQEMLLVSLDRELKDNVKKYNVDSVDVFEFYKILQNTLQDDAMKNFVFPETQIKKQAPDYKIIEDFDTNIDTKALDLLMEEASLNHPDFEKDDFYLKDEQKKGKEKTTPKKEKRYKSKIKKL
ncbi:MAG: NYN domain-containing protein [bacterium]